MGEPQAAPRPRRPWLAGLLALVVPGLGHYYSGALVRAASVYLLALVTGNVALAILTFVNYGPYNLLIPAALMVTFQFLVVWDAVRTAKQNPDGGPPGKWGRVQAYIGLGVVGCIALRFMLPVWGSYEGFYIPAGSMEDALLVGDYVWVEKARLGGNATAVNDVIVFRYPLDASVKYVKRCVAVGGQTVEIKAKQLYVDGQAVPLPPTVKFIDTDRGPRTAGGLTRDNVPLVRVPADQYFVLGDNRDRSSDSRFWGFVPKENVIGKAVRIYWSSDWHRIGLSVK
jgi:signal peptidase I